VLADGSAAMFKFSQIDDVLDLANFSNDGNSSDLRAWI
jgi:hypothetical protein